MFDFLYYWNRIAAQIAAIARDGPEGSPCPVANPPSGPLWGDLEAAAEAYAWFCEYGDME